MNTTPLSEGTRQLLHVLCCAARFRAGRWFPFASVYDSPAPHDLRKAQMGGLSAALCRRGLLEAAGPEVGAGRYAVRLTEAGIAAAREG